MPQITKNVLSRDVEIEGTVFFQGELTTDGKIDGDVLASGTLTIGKDGVVHGDIQAAVVSVFGTVNGNITVEQRCELRGNSYLIGDLDAPSLVIEEGATFVGRSKVQPTGSHGVSLAGHPMRMVEDSGTSSSQSPKLEAVVETSQ